MPKKNSSKSVETSNAEYQQVLDAIRRIVRSLRQHSKSTEKTVGLSTAQIFVLKRLSESERPLSINELAAVTLTHQSTVSVVVSKLVNRQLIHRSASAVDSRSVQLSISKQGEYLLSKSPSSIQERLMVALSEMRPVDRRNLIHGLHGLVQKAGLQDEEASMLMEDDEP